MKSGLAESAHKNAYRIDLKGESQRKRNKPPPLEGGDKGTPA